MKRLLTYFKKRELFLWLSSILCITISYLIFDNGSPLTLVASLIGVTAIILGAKGNPLGMFLMVVFSILYGIISYSFAYYGEMITYLGMTGPMSLFSLISWLRNPFKGNHAEVTVNHVTKKEYGFMSILTILVTVLFYFILAHFNTANLYPSTLSVTTSFAAVYLTFRRSAYFSLAYALNDTILILLWALASFHDTSYIAVTTCFVAFLANDLYAFVSWRKMAKNQSLTES